MNKELILKCLKANKELSSYEVIISDKNSRELFYVLDHLEISRAVKFNTTIIKVYVDDKKAIGSSTIAVNASDDEKTLNIKIKEAVKKAKAVKNNFYPLVEKQENIIEKKPSDKDLNAIASNVAEAVLKADVYEEGWINSTEIFVSAYDKEFINSNGVNHKYYGFDIEIEVIPTWSNKKEEIELYKYIESNKVDYKRITKEVNEIMLLAKDRSNAKKLSEVKLPKRIKVLVKNDMRDVLVKNLISDLSYRELFMHQNHYVLKDVVSNNPFSLTMKPIIMGCADSRKVDGNGIVLKPKKIIDKGTVKSNYGDIQFGYYLGVKDITGNLPVCELKAQGVDYENEKHIIVETFSSPQLEENSGYWGGEVRLARYFDGKKYIPLTSFSISGSIYEDFKKVQFSKEQDTSSFYKGPKYFIFDNIKIH